jgi:hypothetical protein
LRFYSGFVFAIGCCAVVMAAAGCGGSSGPTAPAYLPPQVSPQSIDSFAKSKTLLYVATGDAVHVFTESGHQTQVFAKSTGADVVAMDDAGNVYVAYNKNNLAYAARYAIGGSKPLAKYTPSTTGDTIGYVLASHKGEVVWFRLHQVSGGYTSIYDIWDPGESGPARRTFTYPSGVLTLRWTTTAGSARKSV